MNDKLPEIVRVVVHELLLSNIRRLKLSRMLLAL